MLPNKGVVSFNPQHNGARSAEKIELSADIDAPWHLASMSPHHGPSLAVRQHAREGGESWLALCFSGVRPRRRFSYFSLSVDLRITVRHIRVTCPRVRRVFCRVFFCR